MSESITGLCIDCGCECFISNGQCCGCGSTSVTPFLEQPLPSPRRSDMSETTLKPNATMTIDGDELTYREDGVLRLRITANLDDTMVCMGKDYPLIVIPELLRLLADALRQRDYYRVDGKIAHYWFEKHFGEGFNGRDLSIKCPMADEEMKKIAAKLQAAIAERDLLFEQLPMRYMPTIGMDMVSRWVDDKRRAEAAEEREASLIRELKELKGD